MQIYAYLTFEGDCEEAMRHYAKVLGGKIVAMRRTKAPRRRTMCRPIGAPRSCMRACMSATPC